MTEPSQYFKGRTVQEQMNEVIGYVDTRAAEVATTAIAADVAQVHQDRLDADADAQAAAASAAAAAGTLANAVKKTGEASQSIAGDIAVTGNLTGGSVTVPTPVNNTDAVNKKYVDDQDALDVHLAGAETISGVKTFSSSPIVPTEATGTFSTKAATSDKVKNELDNYSQMVRTTDNQTIAGTKNFTGSRLQLSPPGTPYIEMKGNFTAGDANQYQWFIQCKDTNGVEVGDLILSTDASGNSQLLVALRKADGTTVTKTLATVN